jgi:hypothetical protein
MRNLRQRGKIGSFPFVPGIAVNTMWDFGLGDTQTIWLHQLVAGENRFVGYFEDSGMGWATTSTGLRSGGTAQRDMGQHLRAA